LVQRGTGGEGERFGVLVSVEDGWREELGGELRDSGVTLRRLPVRIGHLIS